MQTHAPEHDAVARDLDQLQACLRAERSAVDTYELALTKVNHVGMHHELQEMFTSHARRADMLGETIAKLGGTPTAGSGAWGALAKGLQLSADLLGDRAAIDALEAGEEHTLSVYTEMLTHCDPLIRAIVETDLMPAQQHTHEVCRAMKRFVHEPS